MFTSVIKKIGVKIFSKKSLVKKKKNLSKTYTVQVEAMSLSGGLSQNAKSSRPVNRWLELHVFIHQEIMHT